VFDEGDEDVVADEDLLAGFAGEDEHQERFPLRIQRTAWLMRQMVPKRMITVALMAQSVGPGRVHLVFLVAEFVPCGDEGEDRDDADGA
jgi:hypothetical protein